MKKGSPDAEKPKPDAAADLADLPEVDARACPACAADREPERDASGVATFARETSSRESASRNFGRETRLRCPRIPRLLGV